MEACRCPSMIFWALGTIFALFYGLCAIWIFSGGKGRWKDLNPAQKVYQAFFNGAGGAVGWGAAYILCRRFSAAGLLSIGIADIGILLIALVGITGLLPYTLANLSKGGKLPGS